MFAQTVCAVAQLFVLGIPARLAAVWFGPNEVSTATSIGVFGNQVRKKKRVVNMKKNKRCKQRDKQKGEEKKGIKERKKNKEKRRNAKKSEEKKRNQRERKMEIDHA